ncbi:uncharacterized protein [Asterias amurensis]|uniref:uncharacterized protein isoform X2 n=1 Tax=Asterias amurensis TaxID=7602 RepID=UPI003AB49BC4
MKAETGQLPPLHPTPLLPTLPACLHHSSCTTCCSPYCPRVSAPLMMHTAYSLKIYDGENTDAPLLGSEIFCGQEFSTPLLSSGHSLVLHFHSDGVCSGQTITVPAGGSGFIESPLYPDVYPGDISCGWLLQTDPGHRINVNFDKLLLNNDCTASNIQFYDGSSQSANLLGQFCQTDSPSLSPPNDVSSTTNFLYFSFSGDSNPVNEMFQLVYSTDIDDCAGSNDCQNGVCRDGVNTYTCDCTAGYMGDLCERVAYCADLPCQFGTCYEVADRFTCACDPGYDGLTCDNDIDECSSTPCGHGGQCEDQVNGFICSCADGFTDDTCQTNINECESAPCQHDSPCVDEVNGYQCLCTAGYEGNQCQTDINECESNPCLHGSTCIDGLNNYECICVLGYNGINCEQELNECGTAPCQHESTCLDLVNDYQCICTPGYNGNNCQNDINECASLPCQHVSTCNDEVNGYQCECQPGYEGTNCQIDTNECASLPCQHGSTCHDEVNGYQCECQPGYEGTNCQLDVDECASNPCQNGSPCEDQIDGYQCECLPGYDGTHCQIDINECASLPCQHGSTCTDEVNGYQCACLPGYDGINCQTDINECASKPCANDGECSDLVNGYKCRCQVGYTGTNCTKDVDECASDPCYNDGECVDLVNSYRCDCAEGFIGDRCEAEDIKEVCAGGQDDIEGSGLVWDETEPGETNIKACPEGVIGNASRLCDVTANWANPDLSGCVSPAFAELNNKVELLKSGNASASDVLDLATSLQNITGGGEEERAESKKIYPGDMDIAAKSFGVIAGATGSAKGLDVDTAKDLTMACAGTFDNVADESQLHAWKNANNPGKVASSVTEMMGSMEAIVDVVVRQDAKTRNSSQSYDNSTEEETILLIKEKNLEIQVKTWGDQDEESTGVIETDEDGQPLSRVELPADLLDWADEINSTGPVRIMTAKYKSAGDLLTLESSAAENESRSDFVNTNVLSVKVLGLPEDNFQDLASPVRLVFKHKETGANNSRCVYLNMTSIDAETRWSNVGCYVKSTNATHTVCECTHLTNFAILMDVHGVHDKIAVGHQTALSVLSYIGGTLSVLGCFFSIIIYQFFRLKSDRIRVHENLAATIALSQLIFLVGIERNEVQWVCKVIAIVLHYSLTAMFCWMLVEGIQLYLALVHVFGSSSHIKKYLLLGWGAPLFIVGISVGVFYEEYAPPDGFCWMTQKMILIIFVPTVSILIILNTAVLVIVLKVMMTSLTAREKSKDSDTSQIKTGMKAAMVLLPLLGLTWVFGYLSVSSYTLVFTYLFAICNSLQGLFFFIAHCVMNIEVKKAYERRYGRKRALHSMTTSSTAPMSSRSGVSSATSKSMRKPSSDTTELTKRNSTSTAVTGVGCDNPALDVSPSKDSGKTKDGTMNNTSEVIGTDSKKTAPGAVKVNDIQCLVKNSEKVNDEEKGLVEGAKVAMTTILSKDINIKMDGSNIA